MREKTINITKGGGTGRTQLSAFDRALYDAGVANFNLIRLSSVIPPGSILRIKKMKMPKNEDSFGHKLFVVMASYAQTVPNKEAWAGLGWVQDKTGKGLFVEHTGESKKDVERLITDSLNDMVKYRENHFSEIRMNLSGIKCKDKPACAIVAAVYEEDGWNS